MLYELRKRIPFLEKRTQHSLDEACKALLRGSDLLRREAMCKEARFVVTGRSLRRVSAATSTSAVKLFPSDRTNQLSAVDR